MRNTLKKLFVIFILVLTVLAFAACSKNDKDDKDKEDKKTEKSEKSDKDDDDDDEKEDKKDDKKDDKDEDDDNNVDTPTEPVKEETTPEPTEDITPEPTEVVTPEPTVEPTAEPTAEPDFGNSELTGVYKLISIYSRGSDLVSQEDLAAFERYGFFYGSLEVNADGTGVLRYEDGMTKLKFDDTMVSDVEDRDSMTYELSDTTLVLTGTESKIIATFVKMNASEVEMFNRISGLDEDEYKRTFRSARSIINVTTPTPRPAPDDTDIDLADLVGSYKVVSLSTNGTEINESTMALFEARGLTLGIAKLEANGTVTVSIMGTEISGTFDGENITINGNSAPVIFEDGKIKLEQDNQSIQFKKMTPEEENTLKAASASDLYSLYQ